MVGKNINVRPKDDPERYEAIFIFQYNLTVDTTHIAVYRTVRDKNGSLIELREGDIPNNEIGRALSPAIDALVRGYKRGKQKGNERTNN